LWFYPNKVEKSKFELEPFIGDTIKAEVRVYSDAEEKKSVYVSTNMGDWLVKLVDSNGIIHSEGFLDKESGPMYPAGNYETVSSFTFEIEEPHQPDFGMSPRKEKMIQATEEAVRGVCKDFASGTESSLWRGSKAYIADFYEYEEGVEVWFVRQDGYVWYFPFQITEKNGVFETQGIKGFGIDHIEDLDPMMPGRFMFDKQTSSAVRQLECN